jgi:hypothetical protein
MDWTEARPVLGATYELLATEEQTTPERVCQRLGVEPQDPRTIRALALLYQADYIDGMMVDQSPAPIFIRPTEKGLRQASNWPGAGDGAQLELLLRLLDERIESDDTSDEEKGKLRRLRDSLGDLGRDVAVGLLTAYLSRVTGTAGDGG